MYIIEKRETIDLAQNMINKEGGLLQYSDGSLSLYLLLPGITNKETALLERSKIFVRIFSEGDGFMIPLFRFGNEDFIMEGTFDYTLYNKDNRIDGVLTSNLLTVLGIDSTTRIVKSIRVATLSENFYATFVQNCLKSLHSDNFSEKYIQWINDIYKRYDSLQLWNLAKPCGMLGEQKK